MNASRYIFWTAAFVCCLCHPTLAQENNPPAGPLRPSPGRVQEQLDRDRPAPAPLPPAGRQTDADRPEPDQKSRTFPASSGLLLPEDYPVANAEGTLESRESRWYYVCELSSQPLLNRPIQILPNSQLEKMERYALGSGKTVRFSIAGLMTEYHNQNYLLVRDVAILRTSTPPLTAQTGDSDSASSADELISAMQREAPRTEALPDVHELADTSAGNRPQAVPPGQQAWRTWAEDSQQVDRLGRLVREQHYWLFAFESHSDEPEDPPIELLPNLALEKMAQLGEDSSSAMLFKVTGDITEYAGQNYMLVRRFTIHRDHGNLGK